MEVIFPKCARFDVFITTFNDVNAKFKLLLIETHKYHDLRAVCGLVMCNLTC